MRHYIHNKYNIYIIKYEFTEKTWRELLDTRARWIVLVRTFFSRKRDTPHTDETGSRASEKGAHYSENSRESIFYLVGKSRKLPLISPVKDYSRSRNKIVAEEGGGKPGERSQAEGGEEGGLKFPGDSNPISASVPTRFPRSPVASGSFNSLPSTASWNYRIIGKVISDSRLFGTQTASSKRGPPIDWSFCRTRVSLRRSSVTFFCATDEASISMASRALARSNDR